MVGLMSVCKLIFLILWSFGFLIFTSCVKAPAYEFDLHLYQVDESLLECPSGWHKFRNNCYFIVKEETTFQEADILCKRYGGYLVKIDGYNTNKGLGQLITNHNLSHVWIGLQRKQSGEFWWSNGQLAEVEDGFWANQSPILPSEYDLCTVMNLSTSNYGDNRWTLDHCDIRFSSICQTSACVAGQFRCSDGNGCISNSWICDGVYQCSDRSDEQLCSGSCGGHLQGILQTFHSPYYPQTYPKYSSCVWRLETPVGTRVKLKFESFMVEELYDKVIIYDGSSENDPLVGTYSGNTIPNVPYSSSNFILVIFQSDQDNQMSGFNATFLAVPKDECGSVLNASDLTQWLTSPNFPNSYPNNVICDWVIRSKNTEDLISFQFISLSLDTSDFVEIRQGESVDSPLYGRYTGEHIPPVFVATSHSLFVRLYTDNTKAAIGFNATFSIGCKNTIRNGYARIMSPGYGITKYPNSINCNWTIIDPEKRQLTLVFDQFDTEKDYDNVTVYLDNQTDYRHSGPVTPLPIRIDSDIFFITFNPDSQVNRKGWSLTVSYDCPSLNLTDHLKINSSTTTFGTYVLFSCDKGYQLSGTSVLICDIGGRWSASPPTCKVINCGSPALPDNMALVSLDTTRYLGNAVYRCNPGFVMTTGKVSICQSNGKWSLPYCTELNCPKLATSERLTFSSNTESHYVYGDIVTYNCDSNYRLIGASMTYCTANGTWSKSTPMCKAPMCPQIYILNGYTNTTEDISGGDYVFVTCNHGYTLIGSPVVHCGLNGMYTSLPSCQEVNECETGVCGEHTCQNLPGSYRCVCNHGYQNHPDNQTICTDVDECAQMRCNDICKNYDGGFQCKCVPGLHLYTEDTRVVKQKILWPNKTCIAKCPSFTVSNGGIIISDTYPLSTGEYIAPTTVSIHCPHGTIPDGSETVECHMGGAWNDTVTTCFNQPCQQLSAPSNGHVTYSNISRVYNSVATYSCDQGYELHGVKYRYCQSVNGSSQFEWTGIAPLCKEKMCPTLPDPTNGKAVYASTAIGSTMKYNCNCGYHLIGSQSRICQPEGLWDGRNAICAPSSVCQSPVTYSSIKLSKVLPFYAVGSEINYQCGKPGYEISETTALKCVIERPTRRPTFDLLFEMKFLTLASFNQSCVNVYVKEIVELFKLLVQNNCTRPRPSEKIIADVKNGNVLQVDLTIQLSKPEGGSISSVCQCRSKLLMIVNTGEIQKNLNNHTLNGSGDETCPVVRLKTVDDISITSNWTCGKGYEFVYSKDTCTTDLEPVCVKSTGVLPKYVIQIYSVLKPTELTEQCKTEINLYISSILNSTAGVSGTLQSSKLCSKYIIRVTIETTIKMKATSIEVTKTYGLSGQIQSILTPCGESIAEKLFSELKDSLTDLPSKTTCLQSLESSNIAINQWKCIDGYILDSSGEICNIVEQTTVLPVDVTTVSPHVTTISEHSRTTVTKNVTMVTTNPDTTSVTTTTAIVTEAPTSHTTQTTTLSTTPTTTEPSSTTPTSTTTAMTTPGSTLPPTSLPFFLIQVAAVYTGTNLTSDGCINGMRSQIEEKVKAVSESIINGLKSWKQCSKQTDLVLLTKTGKISVVPDKLSISIKYPSAHRLELTAPFAIQSSSGQVDTVTDCAIYGVQDHVNDKFNGLLSEVNPVVCYVTYAEFSIIFADWSCNDHYNYNRTSHICHLIQTTTTSSSASSTSLNGLEASDIKYFFPHGRLLLSVESFANVSMTDEAFCLSEYRNILASLLISQTVMINAGNLFDTNCPDIFISLYGIDVHPDDLNISVSKLIMTGDIAVKLFSMSASVTKDGLTVCLGYLANVFMTVNNHILIGQSTIPSSNHSHCSNVALSTVNLSNYFSDCTSGYVRASPGDVYYLCLRDNRTKYIVSLKMSYTWLPPTNKMCIDRLMSELSTSSLYYVGQYAANPEQPCTSDIVLQYTNVTASLLSTYTTGNITMIYELSSITETAAPLSGCSGVIIRNAETYFDEKLSGVFSSIAETCGSTPPQVVMSDVSGSYVCPDGKVWNQVTYQCLIPDGRKKRKKRSAELVRRKRSNTVDTTAYWNSSFPTCIDIEPPVFHNCPSEDLTIYKEAWGPVFINISLPTAVDNSGISPRVTVIPADFRQPYLFRENTDVIFTAEDDTGNSAQCSIQVNLIDVYPLTITCPSEVVYIPYATINDTVFIRYNNTGVTTSSSTTHIQYHPPAGSLISINDHVNVMATAYDTTGNSTSCNFTYEATRDDQLPEYSIKVSYLPPNVNVVVNLTCSMKYGSELIWIFSNISVPQCDDYFMLVPDLLQKHGEQYLVMNVALGFKKMIVLDLDKMENCGNLSAQKMTELGNITLAPSGCNEITLLAVQEETTQEFLCPSNFTVLNKTSKFCTYCRKGTFSNMTSGACEICPITQETIPTECTVCSGRSSHCLDTCKPGEYSPTGLQPCTKCAVGTYTEISNATICRSCPSGKSTINTGTSSLTQCLAGCPIGQYSETGLVPCKPCPQMFYTNTTRSQFCTECSPGLVTTSTGSSSASQCIDPNVCDSDKVCLNGGSCVSVDSGRHFICQCSPGFRGKLCETYINECLSGPCVKGVCIDEEDSYSCICDQGYTGYNCDVTIDNCTPGECGNGTCVDGSHTCICYEGFTGNSTCEEKNECLPDLCEHGGVCIDLIDDFVCNCTGTGYTGKNCSILPQKCYNGSCLNDGVCHPHNLGYSCSCAQGYTGDLCQINIDDCTRHYCKNGAVCVDGINSHSCICQPGYSGSQCDVNTHCNDTPCVNKGSCVTTQTGFVCHCLAGYAGILCEVDIDECEHNKCNADKSTCKDGINGYTCECLPGWTGHTCSEHIGQCITSPCTDGSICTDLEDDQFSCTCMEGYTGHNCSVEINECRSSPCFNDGQCIDQVNGYTCTCKDSFTGTNCQHNIDMCLELPCQHNGTCLNLVDTFTCICEAGWTGQRCDTKVDNCLSLPCYNNATCLNIVNDFRCTCLPGYTGNQCQTDINECVSDPCLHDGQCKNVIGGYFCTCTSGYTGPNCNVINQPCPVCQNEATECHNGQCVCLPGYVGPDCGKERDYWYDLYFTPGGRVETEVTRMKNRNQLSLCLWLKVIDSTSSSPVLTLKAVDSDPKIDQEILKLNTDSLHLYYWGERTINFTILEGSWNHICLTWNSEENGKWFLYINGVVQIEGVGFGSGQELPIRQKIVLGPDTVNNNNKFHGIISQVNMYDSMLNATDIATGSGNCSISMPSGTVFRWQDFSSYVNSGAGVIEPSVCRSGGCPTGYSGQFCNSTKDTEPPTVEYCPAFVQVVTTSRLNIVNWTEPRFSDNVEIINIKQSHRSGQVFAYGEYDVMYIAYDRENNTAVCSFTVYVIPSNCTMPVPSSKVIMTCSNWSDGIYCTIRCKNPVMHKFVEEIPPFYKCGREGFWDPPRGEEFTFPTCAESSQPAGTIQGEMVFLGPLCTTSYREILSQNFVNSMNQWNMEFEMCPGNVCNFSNITVECVTSVRRRRRRSTKGTYLVIFDIPVNGSLVSEGDGGLPLTQLETMVKNEEFNTEDFSCDPASLVVKPYVTCQTGQILVNGLCVNCARGTYMNPSSGSCELCPRGQYTDHEKQVRCQSCDLGYTTEFPGASSSSHCYKSCKTGNYFDKSTLDCRPCEIGYYQDETGKMSCKSCGNGQTTQQTGSTSEVDCLSTCGAGTELSVLGICEPCVLGTYKPNDNQDSCQSCPYGYSTLHVGAISVHQCSVVSCPPDYFHNTAAQKCQVCPPAYHQPITGQNSCIPCNKFDIRPKCLSGEIDECALRQDNCDENADCIDTPKHFDCRCKYGYQGNGTICVYKCIGICNEEEICLIDNSGDPQCLDNSESLPVAALAGGASSLVLVMILIITVIVCKRRKRKKIKERRHNYQTIDRVHRELEVVTYPRRIPVTVAYKTNPAYSDSELSDPTFLGNPSIMWSMYSDPHEDLSKYCETSLRRPLRLRITAAMKNEQHFETISNKSWHDSSPGSSLDEYREDSHHSSPNSSISKYRADSNPKDSSPDSSIGQYKEDSLHKNDSPTSNKSDFSDSYF